jgi:hypothetical protein
VRLDPVAPRPFTLLHDQLDRPARRRQAGDRSQFLPLEGRGDGLRARRPDENGVLAVAVAQAGKPGLDPPVQVAHRLPWLGRRGDRPVDAGQGLDARLCGEALGVLQRHPLGPLQVHEMTQRPLTEGQQRDLYSGRIPPRQDREVGALEMRCRADSGQDVSGQRQVQHLLLDDVDQRGFPCLHPCDLLRREVLARGALERELRVQVLAHQAMLDLAGLAEQVDKLFPAPHLQRRLSGHRGLASIPSLLRSSSKCRR